MGSVHLLLLSSSPIKFLTINPSETPQNPNFFPQFHPLLLSRSNPRINFGAISSRRFDFDDDFRRKKRRNWWSDDDDDDDDDDDEFVFWEEPNPFDWIFKLLSIFGWMVPAVVISTLLGTGTNSVLGTNSLIMALILPLGQTALSLVMDRLSGSPSPVSSSGRRYTSRRKPKPKNRSYTNNPYVRKSYSNQNARNRTSSGRSTNNSSGNQAGDGGSRFGGWDELDEQVGTTTSSSREMENLEVNGVQRRDFWSSKPSRMRGAREKPLIMRLLIAVFPLLGSWTRFFF